ncbi:MAG: ABC transporter permease [Pseudomonadales bacterium]|jgi:peptide/nickel transport system permease protein|nr:ABC transporter permease [Pseudomonadales bacterium]
MSGAEQTMRLVLRSTSGKVGVALVIFHIVLAIVSPWVVPYDFNAQSEVLEHMGPSLAHWGGLDTLGRDVFTRTLLGGREALLVTIFGTAIAMVWGSLFGMFSGFKGGRTDEFMMRAVDTFLAIPFMILLLLVIASFGNSVIVLMLTLGFLYGIGVIRLARAATLGEVTKDYVLAAQARGESVWVILLAEILPNIRDALMVEAAMRWSWMLLAFSALSFLGFGVTPPTPDWGLMIANARIYMPLAPWPVLLPMIALSSLIIGINLMADALAKSLGLDRVQRMPL